MLAVLLTAALTGPGGDLAPCDPVKDPGCDTLPVRVVPCPQGVSDCRTLAVVRCDPKLDPGCDTAAVALVPCPKGMQDCYTVVPCPVGVVDCRTLAPCPEGMQDCYALADAGPLTPVADPRFSPAAADLPPAAPCNPKLDLGCGDGARAPLTAAKPCNPATDPNCDGARTAAAPCDPRTDPGCHGRTAD